jgi:hypothetical protein
MRWLAGIYHGRKNAYQLLFGIYERKRPLGKHRRRWNDNKFDLKEMMRWSGLD